MGGRYINSDRMKVHLRKQENDTSLNTGFSYIALRYIADVKWGACLQVFDKWVLVLTDEVREGNWTQNFISQFHVLDSMWRIR